MRRSTPMLIAALIAGATASGATGAVIVPGTEAQAGAASVDLDTNGRALVAYERTVRGRVGVYASTRTAARFRSRDAGVRLGFGRLELARLADGGGPDVVVWSRGRIFVALRRGGPYRTEVLPASVPRRRVLAGGVAGRRVVLVVGDAAHAAVVVRSPAGVWRSVPLPGAASGRSAMRVAVSEGSGRVVAAWTQGGGPAEQAVLAAVWSPGPGTWSAPATLAPAGGFGAPVAARVRLNRRGAAIVQVGRNAMYAGSFAPAPEPRLHVLDAGASAWRAATGIPAGTAGLAPDGTVVHAWFEPDGDRADRIMTASLPPGSGAWGAATRVARIERNEVSEITGIDDVAVAENGRVALVAELNPGPAPDEHLWYSRTPTSPTWRLGKGAAGTYGEVILVPGRQRIAVTWRADASLSGMPEGDLLPG